MTKMQILGGIFLVIILVSLVYGFFHRFRTKSSKNFYKDAEYGKQKPEEYGTGGFMGKIKGKMGGGGSGNPGGPPPSGPRGG